MIARLRRSGAVSETQERKGRKSASLLETPRFDARVNASSSLS